MQTYEKFRPASFDPAGAFLDDDHQDWLVLPVSQTRDSGPYEQSNFAAALEILGGESDDVEVHRFGHWGPGWFEIIIVRPGSDAAEKAKDIESRLENYPVLDERDMSRREWDDFIESWDNWARRDFCKDLGREFELTDAAAYVLDDLDGDVLREFYMDNADQPYFCDDSGVCVPTEEAAKKITRDQMANLLRLARNQARKA